MNCPKCGLPVEEGKAYCSNPACGAPAEPEPPRFERTIQINKKIKIKVDLNLQTLARVAAIAVTVVAGAYIFFSARR